MKTIIKEKKLNENTIKISDYIVQKLKYEDEEGKEKKTTCIQLGDKFIPECETNTDYIRYQNALKKSKE